MLAQVFAFLLIFVSVLSVTARGQVQPPEVRSFANANASSATASTNNQNTDPIARFATNQRAFQIPFALQTDQQIIVHVALYASADRGRTWQLKDQVRPTENHFEYRTTRDGEYWFAVQTTDRNGSKLPARIFKPDIIVLVDTEKPELTATALDDAAGRINIRWRAVDDHIASESVLIKYRAAGQPLTSWTTLPIRNPASEIAGPIYQDSLAFWPEFQAQQYEVELSIADSAGNRTATTTTVEIKRPAPRSAWTPASQQDLSNPNRLAQKPTESVASDPPSPRGNNVSSHRSSNESTASVTPNAAENTPYEISSRPVSPAAVPQSVPWNSQPLSQDGQLIAGHSSLEGRNTGSGPPTRQDPSLPGLAENSTEIAEQTADSTRDATTAPPRMSDRFAEAETRNISGPTSPLPNPSPNDGSPTNSVLRLRNPVNSTSINTPQFRLNYTLDSLSAEQVAEVAVWMTRDNGQTWHRQGTAVDVRQPYTVTVDASGIYGFRLVVATKDGVKGRIPQAGDEADKWVRVDLEPPRVQILSAPYGTGTETGQLIINWAAEDDLLAVRPIDLFYSSLPDGPWTTIERGLRNDGRFAWQVDSRIPTQVYLRISARDEAGNQTSQVTVHPIDLGNLFPRGQIDSVEPIR